MLLTADIGNTNIKFGIFNQRELIRTLTISCNKAKTADEYGVELYSLIRVMGIHRDDFSGCIISSVVPLITTRIEDAVRAAQSEGKPFKVTGDRKGVAALYRNGNLLLVNAENKDKKIYVDTGSDTSDVYDPLNDDYIFAERTGSTLAFTLKAYASVIVK